ncbi:MAG: type III pantothenate kinase [Aquificaceae bacterium]|nr:type III pantothenate kinase [Aquificaceae bacterium]MDW8097745.1 type III pantothenate kinase [Aquificaceae bacterium]
MKVLTLDLGNTSVDLCLFEKELLYIGKFSPSDLPVLKAEKVLVSSVRPSAEALVKEKYPQAEFVRSADVPVNTTLCKEKVGVDRLLNLYGAVRLYGEDLVVVSAGTALVVDLSVQGTFCGGFIVPGLALGLECLCRRAELLPELNLKELRVSVGTTTEEAVVGGIINQSLHFVKACVESWSHAYGRELKVVLTGGDGWLLRELGLYDPLLLHRAMLLLAGFCSAP